MPDAYAAMTDEEFMRVYRSKVHFAPQSNPAATYTEKAKLQAELARRGLTFPDSWVAAGIRTAEEDF